VYEYLLKTPACNQTRESIFEFVKRSEGFRLAEADRLNVINCRPSSAADAYAVLSCYLDNEHGFLVFNFTKVIQTKILQLQVLVSYGSGFLGPGQTEILVNTSYSVIS
jgi:hypothetical protein